MAVYPHAGVFGSEAWPNQRGRLTPGALVGIYNLDGITLADLFDDRDRTNPVINPITLNAVGNNDDFYAEPASYLARRIVDGVPQPAVQISVPVDPADAVLDVDGPVVSVNGQTGVVELDAADVGADTAGAAAVVAAALAQESADRDTAIAAHIIDSIADGDTTHAPSRNAVFDALAAAVVARDAAITAAVVGLWDDRGNYDASSNLFPASGGSGAAGAVLKGDLWTISVVGTLGGQVVSLGDTVRAKSDAPGQTAGSWAIAEANLGYTPENVTNKSTSTSLGTSDTAYPSQKAVKTYVDATGINYTPEKYGAIGDGTTDDTAALVACMQAASAARGAMTLNKSYRYSSIQQTLDNLTIQGFGSGRLISLLGKTDNTIALRIIGSNVHIDAVVFDFVTPLDVDVDAAARAASADTIRLGGLSGTELGGPVFVSDVSVTRCKITNSRNTPIGVRYASKVRVTENTLTEALGNGIFVASAPEDVEINGNFVRRTGDDSIAVVTDSTLLPTLSKRVVVSGNMCSQSYAQGIDFTGVDGAVMTDNHIEDTWTSGIFVWHQTSTGLGTSNNVLVRGNVVRNAGKYFGAGQFKTAVASAPHGIYVTSAVTNVTVSDNIILTPQGRAIAAPSVSGLVVSGNFIRNTNVEAISVGAVDLTYQAVVDALIAGNDIQQCQGGIYVQGSSNVTVTGNKVRTFKNGSSGTTRAVWFNSVSVAIVGNNLMVNDDAGTYGFRQDGTNLAVRDWNNQLIVPANSEGSFAAGAVLGGSVPQRSATGNWVSTPGTASATTAATNGRIYYTPFSVTAISTMIELNCRLQANGSDVGRSVADGVLNSTTTVTSATAAFVSTDVGKSVTGTGIPANTYVQSVTNGTTIVLTRAATATASGVSLTFTPVIRMGVYADNGLTSPSTLLLDAGTVSAVTAALKTISSLSIPLSPGTYWFAIAVQGSSGPPTFTTLTGRAVGLPQNQDPATSINGMVQDNQFGALPTPAATSGQTNTAIAMTGKL